MKYLVLVFASVVILLGCTSTPSMENYTNDPDRMWEEGKKLSERGEKLLTRGEKDLEKARAMLREGEGSIQSGTEKIIAAKQAYQLAVLQLGASTSPKEVAFEATTLSSIGERWEDAINEVRKGNSLIEKSKDRQVEAFECIKEGQQLIEQGSKFIRNSQRIKLNAPIIGEIE